MSLTQSRFTRPVITSAALIVALALTLSGCAAEPVNDDAVAEEPAVSTEIEPEQLSEAPHPEPEPEQTASNPGFDQGTLDELLRQAAWTNDLDLAAQFIGWGANVNAKDHTEQSAFLVATSEGHLEFLRLTLAHGGDVHSLDSWVGTGLIRAAERGHWDVVGELVQAGVPLDHMNRVGYHAIHEAVWMGRDDLTYHATTRVLFAAGANFAAPSGSEGLTPLQMAERRGFAGQAEVIRNLLSAPVPADPTAALFDAAAAGNVTLTAAALRAGASPSATNSEGQSALDIALGGSHVLTAQLLRALSETAPSPGEHLAQ